MPENQFKSHQPGATLTDSPVFIGNCFLCQASIPNGFPSFGHHTREQIAELIWNAHAFDYNSLSC